MDHPETSRKRMKRPDSSGGDSVPKSRPKRARTGRGARSHAKKEEKEIEIARTIPENEATPVIKEDETVTEKANGNDAQVDDKSANAETIEVSKGSTREREEDVATQEETMKKVDAMLMDAIDDEVDEGVEGKKGLEPVTNPEKANGPVDTNEDTNVKSSKAEQEEKPSKNDEKITKELNTTEEVAKSVEHTEVEVRKITITAPQPPSMDLPAPISAHNPSHLSATVNTEPPKRYPAKTRTKPIQYQEKPFLSKNPSLRVPDTILKVFVPSRFIHVGNSNLVKKNIWGDLVYSEDSDLLVVLVHLGYITVTASPPDYAGLSVTIRILPAQNEYFAKVRNGLRSRRWAKKASDGLSYQIDRVAVMEYLEGKSTPQEVRLLTPKVVSNELMNAEQWRRAQIPRGPGKLSAAQAAALLNSDTLQPPPFDISIIFSLSNDPAMKYNLSLVGDSGMDRSDWTSSRLQREVFCAETSDRRFELGVIPKTQPPRYRWSEVRDVLSVPIGGPGTGQVRTIANDLSWEEIVWGQRSVIVRGVCYELKCCMWRTVE